TDDVIRYFHVTGVQTCALPISQDSLYVFATVNIDPSEQDNPFVVTDELQVSLHGRNYQLPITAYGQNAHYIIDSVLPTQTWGTEDRKSVVQGMQDVQG